MTDVLLAIAKVLAAWTGLSFLAGAAFCALFRRRGEPVATAMRAPVIQHEEPERLR